MKHGIPIVISGFSGAGKGTVVKELVKKYGYGLSISATSRLPREGEQDGREYYFKTREEFEQMIAGDELVEWNEYVGNYYGTPKFYIQDQLSKGNSLILEIEMNGALNVKKAFPDALLIFITPPDAETLKNRLVGRGTESEEVIGKRLSQSYEESDFMKDYHYIIINDVLEECVEQIHYLICNEQQKVKYQQDFIHGMKAGLEKFRLDK